MPTGHYDLNLSDLQDELDGQKQREQLVDIRFYADVDRAIVDRFVCDHPESQPVHRPAWREAVIDTYGGRDVSLIAEHNGQIVGFLPLWASANRHKSYAISAPFGNHAGPLITKNTISVHESLRNALGDLIRSGRLGRIEIRSATQFELGSVWVLDEERAVYSLNLEEGIEAAWKHASKTARNQKRKAEKSGLCVWQDQDRITDFFNLYVIAMRNHGTPCHPFRWFISLAEHFGSDFTVSLVGDQSGKMFAAQIVLKCGQTIAYPWQSADPAQLHQCPNDLLIWGLIEYADKLGCNKIDMGRSLRKSSQSHFKEKWGGKEERIALSRLPYTSSKKRLRTFLPPAMMTAVWQKLPIELTRILGPKIRRYIP